MTSKAVITTEERALLEAVGGMMGSPDMLLPLAAAERQFRDYYYGLNSAALLEDLFFDALGNHLARRRPDVTLTRPAPGQKGWDYALDSLRVSHKVSQGPGVIAAIWDATLKDVSSWTFGTPIVYTCTGHSPATQVLVGLSDGQELRARAVADLPRPYLTDGRPLVVVSWPAGSRMPHVLEHVPTRPGQTVADALPFRRLWRVVARYVEQGHPVNDIEILTPVSGSRRPLTSPLEQSEVGAHLDLSVRSRSGIYLLPVALLQNLAVSSNNRGILIPKTTVEALTHRAAQEGLFVPFPLWYWAYAQDRPPDLYSAQRAEYDHRFSARGRTDSSPVA